MSTNEHILFVTGRLAERGVRDTATAVAERAGFSFDVAVPGIQVAALLHTDLLKRRLNIPSGTTRVILPGWTKGSVNELTEHFGIPFEAGPKDYRDLPQHFGLGTRPPVLLDDFSVEIIAEINHATRLPTAEVLRIAQQTANDGADIIDLGCVPGESSPDRVTELTRELRDRSLRVSVDSFDRAEVTAAVSAGAELVLSADHSNIEWASELPAEFVLIPDEPSDSDSLRRLIDEAGRREMRFRADPIIEPIGMGFLSSLKRYIALREEFPDVEIMMGIGNITEMTEADSAGVNAVLAAVCEELGIRSVLTTQVANWCRNCVREFELARRLMFHAVSRGVVPKHADSGLVMLRDSRLKRDTRESVSSLAAALSDANFRIAVSDEAIHLLNRHGHSAGRNPFEVYASALARQPEPPDSNHAFYLGYEMARAELALLLGKNYRQDEPMPWGIAGTLRGSSAVRHPDPESHQPDDNNAASNDDSADAG